MRVELSFEPHFVSLLRKGHDVLKDPSELSSLLSSADYEKFIAEEGGH